MAAAQECPNCCLNILPSADGTCPSCQCNLAEAATRNRDQSTVWITNKVLMPQICCSCAAVTNKKVRISENEYGERESSSGWIWTGITAIVGMCFGWPFLLLAMLPDDEPEGLSSRVISGKIPQCPNCQAQNRPIVPEIDFNRGAMKIVVHNRFAQEFEKLNHQAERNA